MKLPENTLQTSYIEELRLWVEEQFGHYISFYLFQVAFNEYFQRYQKDFAKKMNLDSIKNGAVSCSSAALVVATWWSLHHETDPEFFILLERKSPERRHVVLALPYIKVVSIDNLKQSFEDQSNLTPPLIVEQRYKDLDRRSYSLQHAGKNVFNQQHYNISGISNFIKNRFEVFNYQPEDPSPPTEASSSLSTR